MRFTPFFILFWKNFGVIYLKIKKKIKQINTKPHRTHKKPKEKKKGKEKKQIFSAF